MAILALMTSTTLFLESLSWTSALSGGIVVAVITGLFSMWGKKIDKKPRLDESVQSLTETLVKLQKELDAAIDRLSVERSKAHERDRVIEKYQNELFEVKQLLRQTRSLLVDVLVITSSPTPHPRESFAELHNRVEEHSKILTDALVVTPPD